MASSQFVGRDVLVNYAFLPETTDPATITTYKRLGMMRTKTIEVSWDTADSTADQSPCYTKQSLTTFKSVSISGDGVAMSDDDDFGQKDFVAHVVLPQSTTQRQPKCWFQFIDPDGSMWEGPFVVTKWTSARPYADVSTFAFSAESNGAVTYDRGI